MRQFRNFCVLIVLFIGFYIHPALAQLKTASSGGYTYEFAENDPTKTRIYTLDNGLKVYLSVNKLEPRIQTYVAVRTGSKNDPSDATGLAHYLEHMVFKGTSSIGTINWNEEKEFLKQISELYERHKLAQDSAVKVELYSKIDSLSGLAAQYVVPNEFDKMMSSIGAKGLNAYTSLDETVYISDIPSNALEKWMMLESERFTELVLRIFHTELETVFEEYNMRMQDLDSYKQYQALLSGLFQKHTYGTQTTIGEAEHLKNPSMVKIHEYFDTYYVPNNVAICLAGDLDPDETIKLIDKHFGDWKKKELPKKQLPKEDPIKEPIVKEVWGPEAENVIIAFRFDGTNSKEERYIDLISGILDNGQAGIIDLDLVQQQKVLSAGASSSSMVDYSFFALSGKPKEGQSLEELSDLLLKQLEKVKNGEFEDWLIEAVINDWRLSTIKSNETNSGRARAFVDAFIGEYPWDYYVNYEDSLEKLTKADIMKFTKENFQNNYVVVYKRQGENPNKVRLPKPEITPLDIEKNKSYLSEFQKEFNAVETKEIEPVFVDYQSAINTDKLSSGIEYSYIKNELNETFSLYYILDMGSDHDKELAIAINYLPFLGTSKYSASQLQQEFFKLGLSFDVFNSEDRIYVLLSGLESSMEEGVKLFEHILAEVKPDQDALDKLVDRILKSRKDRKSNKGTIMYGGMFNYAKYGPRSSFTSILSEKELKGLDPEKLVNMIRTLTSYKHRVFYYGMNDMAQVKNTLDKYHEVPGELTDYPEKTEFPEKPIEKSTVYFVDFDMAQTQILLLARDESFNKELMAPAKIFNAYFGSGFTSVMFQEIREARALAYSTYASYSTPDKMQDSHYLYAFVGTQADKMNDAIAAVQELLNEMPKVENSFKTAKESVLKKIETDRITRSSVFWSYEGLKELGIDYDIRKDIYEGVKAMDLEALDSFFNKHIKGQQFAFLVMGSKNNIDMESLKKLGEVKELTLEEIFGY